MKAPTFILVIAACIIFGSILLPVAVVAQDGESHEIWGTVLDIFGLVLLMSGVGTITFAWGEKFSGDLGNRILVMVIGVVLVIAGMVLLS